MVEDGHEECEDAVEKLYEFLDGELDAASMQRVEEHLHHCSPCLEAFDFHAQLRHVVQRKCSEQMPSEVRVRLFALLAEGGSGTGPGASRT